MMRGYFLKPGYVFYATESTMILTVLGSSVAVTLYDPYRSTGGMNHFIHPQVDETTAPTALYAQPATIQLIRMFKNSGSSISQLQAHIIGGATPRGSDRARNSISEQNVEIAENMLKHYNIEIAGMDIGGHWGRKIVFNSGTGEVIIAKVSKIREEDWNPELLLAGKGRK